MDAVARRLGGAPGIVQFAAPVFGFAVFLLFSYLLRNAGLGEVAFFTAWQVLFALQTTAWAFLGGAGWAAARALGHELTSRIPAEPPWRSPATQYAALRLVLLNLTLVPIGGGVLPSLSTEVGLLRWTVLGLAAVAAFAAWPYLAMLGMSRFAAKDSDWETAASDLGEMRTLRASLQSSIAALGIIIAMHVVAYGAYRQAVEDYAAESPAATLTGLAPFPEAYVLLYGAVLTAALAAIYWEVSVALERRARAMIDRAAPLTDPSSVSADRFAARRMLRTEIAAELQLGPDLRTQLLAAVGVLSPLFGAVISGLTGIGS